MSNALTSIEINGQHPELLSTHTVNEQHVELLPARNCLQLDIVTGLLGGLLGGLMPAA